MKCKFPKNKARRENERKIIKFSHHVFAINLRQSFDAQSLGEFQQFRYLILEDVDLSRIHERNQRSERRKIGIWREHDDWMQRLILHARFERVKELGEKCATTTQHQPMCSNFSPICHYCAIGEMRLIQ